MGNKINKLFEKDEREIIVKKWKTNGEKRRSTHSKN